jgi:hypothetical protein
LWEKKRITEREGIMDQLTLPKLTPMSVIVEGLRPNDDWYEKKKLDERDDIWKGKITFINKRDHIYCCPECGHPLDEPQKCHRCGWKEE